MIKFIGLILCTFVIFGVITHVGINFYNDMLGLLIVVGGGFGYCLLKNQKNNYLKNFGESAVYFGCWEL